MAWNKIPETQPPEGTPVLFFHELLKDPDFNPKGVCEGYMNMDCDEPIYYGNLWNPEQDCWDADELIMIPTHWTEIPDGPDIQD